MSNVKKVDEETIVTIIASAGEANGMLQQAYMEAVEGNYEAVEELLKKADEVLVKVHEVQTDLIQCEAGGDRVEMGLLMVHAQDHLMNAMLSKQLITNMIEMQKTINQLKK
ncbi:hypothetical protein B5E58_10170 [Tyzzerella sp. An114]|uniref:PTS lactose/cellobiose transporter subunit IIA n=1 Tax=Tyzzerella sp. An114 TaxID=1965545 RepID=UPI000B4418DC|nr:PTS lactose/cellobiose transporter subunit IIA [Tyzzerella sp. An114]OUQ56801.1 hypothetical protein B5E58_10170 [Tyzzerella sp. An114]